jgi:proline dehydrogenase
MLHASGISRMRYVSVVQRIRPLWRDLAHGNVTPGSGLAVREASTPFADTKGAALGEGVAPRWGVRTLITTSGQQNAARLDFFNGTLAFQAQSTVSLVRCWLVLQICGIRPLVKNAESLVKLSYRVLGSTVTNSVMKNTFFAHFCAGENEELIKPRVNSLNKSGIGSILDYAAEADLDEEKTPEDSGGLAGATFAVGRVYDYKNEQKCDEYLAIFTKCVEAVHNVSPSGFAAIKITALGNPLLLQRMSACITEIGNLFRNFDKDGSGTINRQEFKDAFAKYFDYNMVASVDGRSVDEKTVDDIFDKFSHSKDDAIDYIDWTRKMRLEDIHDLLRMCRNKGPLYQSALDEEERLLLRKLQERAHSLAKTARDHGVRLMIDAEHSYFQPAIDSMVYDLQEEFNKDEPTIFNTYQCYLIDSHERLTREIENSRRCGYKFAAKLVRGAYMVMERERAKELGYPSPVFPTLNQTHANYNRALLDILHELKSGNGGNLMIASHNQESVELAVKTMGELGLDPKSGGVYFGQLLGMSDNLTYTLGQNGYNAYKYVPFGKVQEVMPYLIRRAYENSDVFGSVGIEKKMVADEILRRMQNPFSLFSKN